jgi:hypothetical protein
MAKKPGGGKGGRKYGNNQAFCLRYRNEGRRMINKKRKLESHLRRYPEDSQAHRTLKNL